MQVFVAAAAALATALSTAAPVYAHAHAHAHAHHHHHALASPERALGAHYAIRGLEEDNSTMTEYVCPVCGMSTIDDGADDHYYVELDNGQRIYTCIMTPPTYWPEYNLNLSDASYLAANMAAYVEKDSECTDSCDDCAAGIADPISGETITTDNFQYVCLAYGQKIYFASAETKAEYLGNITQELRFAVEEVHCGNSTCDDATEITKLSAAASSADLSAVDSSSSGSSATAGSVGSSSGTSSGSSGALSAHHSAAFSVAVAGVVAVASAFFN